MSRPNPIKIRRLHSPQNFFNDFYHSLMKMRWPNFMAILLLGYLSLNFLFAFMYAGVPGSIGPGVLSYWDSFFFSVQTFSTVGYGHVSPQNLYANIVSTAEIFVGLMYLAINTGLIFAKFSLPKSKILFTNKIIRSQFNGEDSLVFRIANARSNNIMDAHISFYYLYDDQTKEGIPIRRFEELPLQKSKTPIFTLSLMCIHNLSQGPLSKWSVDTWKEKNLEFLVAVAGNDESYGQTTHQTHFYALKDIHEGGRFEDIIRMTSGRAREIDFASFNAIVEDSTVTKV